MDPPGLQAFARAWSAHHRALPERVTEEQLAYAIEVDGSRGAIHALDVDRWAEELRGIVTDRIHAGVMHEAGLEAKRQTVEAIASAARQSPRQRKADPRTDFDASFRLVNPFAVQHAQAAGAHLVTGVSDEVKDYIKNKIAGSIQHGIDPKKIARQLRDEGKFGLLPAHQGAVDRYRAQAIADGLKPEKADKLANKYAGRLLDWRAKTIARTELQTAQNWGKEALWQREKAQGILHPQTKRSWIVTADERTCIKICRPMNGQQRDFGEAFETGEGDEVPRPPAHPNCRCTMGLVRPKEGTRQDLEGIGPPPPSRQLAPDYVIPGGKPPTPVLPPPVPPPPPPAAVPTEEPELPPSLAPAPPEPLTDGATLVESFEASTVREQNYETGFAASADGSWTYRKDGTENSVPFTIAECEEFERRSVIFTHNHPNSSSFSKADIKFASDWKLKEMRAFGRIEGVTHRMRPPVTSAGTDAPWPVKQDIDYFFDKAWEKWKNADYRDVVAAVGGIKIGRGEATSTAIWRQRYHLAWVETAQKLGMRYERTTGGTA